MNKCKKCSAQFELIEEDKNFFERLKFPEPTMCPDCRNIQRMNWRNDRTFYKVNSALSGKPMISLYPADTPYTIYLQEEWYSDKWNAMDYGRDFDFNRPFFEQFAELQLEVPRMNLDIVNCENSEYCNYCGDDKNCYLDIAGEANEDCYYNLFVKYSKDSADCTFIYNSTLCYESINCHDCYRILFGQYCNNTSESAFVYDLIGCKHCLFSINLRNKEYYIYNKPVSKEEYEKKFKEVINGDLDTLKKTLKLWRDQLVQFGIFRSSYQNNCENCTGNNLKNCKNTHFGYNATNCEDCRYLYDVLDAKDCQDLNYSLYKPELSYNLISTLNMTHSACSMASHYCHDVFYCDQCNHSKHLFGCDALTHKQYCILNKQYSKEEYEDLKSRIIEHMKKTGEWGQFFPMEICPFGYNETVAHEYFPLTKEEAIAQGYKWKDEDKKLYRPATKEMLACQACGKNYKIIESELKFYKKLSLPIPAKCPDCRHKDRINLRTPRHLWDRTCTQCNTKVQTAYNPDRPEKIYCEKCYLENVI